MNTKNTKNPLTAELLSISKHALQVANRVGKIDFTKPYEVAKLASPVTFNKAVAAVPALKNQSNYNFFVLLDCSTSEHYYRRNAYILGVDYNRFEVIRYPYSSNASAMGVYQLCRNDRTERIIEYYDSKKSNRLDTFYCQKDLETERKANGNNLYIIWQEKRFQAPEPARKICSNDWIPAMRNREFERYGKRDELDKSGYNVKLTQRALKNRLAVYKANKRRKELECVNFDAELESLSKEYNAFRTLYCNLVAGVEDVDSMNTLMCYDVTRALRYGLSAKTNFKTKLESKYFCSVQQAKNNIDDAFDIVRDAMNKLNLIAETH